MAKLIASALLGAVTLAACAGGGSVARDDAPSDRMESIGEARDGTIGPAAPPEEVEGTNPLPAVDVIDVATGSTVNTGTLLPASKPVLVWFWAPH